MDGASAAGKTNPQTPSQKEEVMGRTHEWLATAGLVLATVACGRGGVAHGSLDPGTLDGYLHRVGMGLRERGWRRPAEPRGPGHGRFLERHAVRHNGAGWRLHAGGRPRRPGADCGEKGEVRGGIAGGADHAERELHVPVAPRRLQQPAQPEGSLEPPRPRRPAPCAPAGVRSLSLGTNFCPAAFVKRCEGAFQPGRG